MSELINRQAAIDYVDDVPYIKDHPNIGLLWKAWVEQLPSAQIDTCDGCMWEDAFGYGECYRCKRAFNDMYEVKNEE